MATKKRKKKKGSQVRPAQILLPILGIVLLLALILLLGDFTASTAPETEPTLPALEANPYLAEDFEYDGAYLRCNVANARLGVDVSEHQSVIDWAQVKEAGFEFAMVRVGYRGYTEGKLFADSSFENHLKGAREAGLDVGVYFFSQALTPKEAKEEAAFVLKALKRKQLDLPVVFDWEYVSDDVRTGIMNGRTLTDCAIAFCEAVEAKGYDAMVYFNQDQAKNMYRLEELTDYDFWLAMYSDQMDFPYRVEMWQYTEEGSVPGIEGNTDINLYLP
jgi:GH25 family lysozyme M1 (1,4-beta-N-acetylmuramidase)